VASFALLAAAAKKNAPKMTARSRRRRPRRRRASPPSPTATEGKDRVAENDVEVDRELDASSPARRSRKPPWDKIKAKMPGGKKKLKPVQMTCEEFLALGSDVQPEVAYWLQGYNRKTKTEMDAAGEVDLERDTAVLIEACKPTPKASLWERIKEKF
jgi:hypothetical protein